MNDTVKSFLSLLNKFRKMNIQEAVNFDRMNEILISHHSTAIEGSSLTEEEVRLLLTEGITAAGKPLEDHNMVKDHQEALVFTIETAKRQPDLSPAFIQQLSSLVMKTTGGIIHATAGSYDSSKGDFRKSMVHVGNRYFGDYKKVPDQVAHLCKSINERLKNVKTTEEIYDLAFDSHYNFVSIHPFADGNGRVSRLVMNYVLAWHKQPLAILYKEDKAEYFQALEQSREEENTGPFRDFMYRQQSKYLAQEIKKAKNTQIRLYFGERGA
jgi:Fic family protein